MGLAHTAAGQSVIRFLQHLSSIYYLFKDTIYWLVAAPLKGRRVRLRATVEQMVEVGVQSLFIVVLISFFLGVILCMQTAYQMQRFGATQYVGSLVSVAFVRELGPLMTALVITGRVGAAFTAELGTMNVSEEILALETMALNPVRFLIVPRFLAIFIMLPMLTIVADVMGMFGGYIIGVTSLNIPTHLYIKRTFDALVLKDIFSGLLKSFIFAMIIVMIASYRAFIVEGGAAGVGRSTMISVVHSMVTIIIADLILTAFFYFLL
jgi:phospholipid/cholesterol/gamma-HCH transport system permease protein